MPAFDIDLTLDSLKIPNINGTFPFGTKITPTTENKGGLSTAEVNSNIMLPFAQMRPKVCSADSTTSQVEYDAKIVFNAPTGVTPSAGYTLTMGDGTYIGCTVTFTNLMEYACTVMQSDGTTTLFSVPAGKTMSAMWNGTAWLWTTSGSVTANDPTPVSSAAVHAAIGDATESISNTISNTIGMLSTNKNATNNNLNNCVNPGVYVFGVNTLNTPNVNYGVVLVFGQRTNIPSSTIQWIFQIAVTADNTNKIYLRETTNPNNLAPSIWTNWREL